MPQKINEDGDTIKLKVIKWYNKPKDIIQYGVDIKVNGRWGHLLDEEGPCIYNTEKEACKKIKDYYFNTK